MAAANKPSAVHFTLIFFVMATLIAGVMAYMNFSDNREVGAKLAALTAEKNSTDTQNRKYIEQIQNLAKAIGREFENVGEPGTADQNTVIGAALADLSKYAGSLQSNTLVDGLSKLRAALDATTQERNQLTAQVNDLKAQMLALEGKYRGQSEQYSKQATDAEAGRQSEIQSKTEVVDAKIKEISELNRKNAELVTDMQNSKDQYEKRIVELETERKRLIAINNRIVGKLEEVTKVSFDKPNGELRWVDYSSKLVWINLGTIDNLPVGTTFSVYSRGHHGVGRGAEDIKGAIEVTRIIGGHLAEARMLKDDPTQPMAAGDPVFTPLWSSGRKSTIAMIGLVDIDGDGQSDRALLHEMCASANTEFDLEVDDQGNVAGPGITSATKYLVIANIPDPSKVSPNEEEAAKKISKAHKEIIEQARVNGVRKVTLNDFLSEIGYKPQRRNWRPGEEQPFNLKNGSHSTSTKETIGQNRTSAGTVSDVYKNTKRVGPARSSTGQTSKVFGK